MNQSSQLPVMETFYTVQGEGAFAGASAFFIRLAGCDVGCVWCDVKESWDADKHPLMEVSSLVQLVVDSGAALCVITGGEPTLHNLELLTTGLKAKGIRTHLETSGTQPLTGEWDWITFSPKKFKAPLNEYYSRSHELKVIINHVSDINWAQEHADKMPAQTSFYMQPEWDKRETMQTHILDYIRRNTQWRISVQTHKYLGVD
ncbi:MAG: 7-carboxy-7-deazaguanine synthase QueE [Flavobacteriales bacterium]